MSDQTIARAHSARGEVLLRRRSVDGEIELRVNGVFVMDTRETSTERALATLALDRISRTRDLATSAPLKVLVGGLGLGFTLREFAASPVVGDIIAVEIEPSVIEWHRSGLIPQTAPTMISSRVHMLTGDVRDAVAVQRPSSLDVIVLDVDNGPGFLVYDDNVAVYQREFLTACREALGSLGVVVVWSADAAPDLCNVLDEVFGSHTAHTRGVRLGNRQEAYHIYLAPRSPREEPQCPAH